MSGTTHTMGHGSLRGYLVGFFLSVVLTAIPFWLVMTGAAGSGTITAIDIMALAVLQIIVHVFYFLHINAKAENGWMMMAFIFTVVMVLIVLSGSLWVMYNLNANMVPVSAHAMSQMM
jgi:cytochrome o ubiquinol oxidase subunit IV